jgi:hypothetical protein
MFSFEEPEPGAFPFVHGRVGKGSLVHVEALPVDDERTELRLSLLLGHFIECGAGVSVLVGTLLERTPFHVRADCLLGRMGRMSVGCNLTVRDDDAPFVQRRFKELLQLSADLDWYFTMRLPIRLTWQETSNLELEWEELPHDDLSAFLDEGLKVPKDERTPLALIRIAQGLGRWQDVLQLLREHPADFIRHDWATLKCLASCELRRWLPAIRAAKEGGIRNGRFPDEPWLSPPYLHALIEGGDEIEALRILGKPAPDEPAFYDWLRGFALHRAGDTDRASEAFERYFAIWPNDVIGVNATDALAQ